MKERNGTGCLTKEVVCFIILACVFSWPVLLLWEVPENDPAATQNAFAKLSPLFALGPFFSAVIVTVIFRGWASLKSLFKPVLKWRVGWVFFLAALAVPVVVQWLALIGWRLCTVGEWNLPSFFPALRIWCIGTPIAATFLIIEETGWRGFLLPRVQSLGNAFSAGLVVGVVWSFWHIPLSIAIELNAGYSPALLTLNISVMFLCVVLLSVLMTWVFNCSGGSLLLMLLMHGSNNVSFFLIAEALNQEGVVGLAYKSFYLLVLLVVVCVLILRYGRQTLSKSDKVVYEDS